MNTKGKNTGKIKILRVETRTRVEPYYYGKTLIGEALEFEGKDNKGNTYTRRVFRPKVSFSELLEIFDGMLTGEKLHLETSAPGIEEAVLQLGFTRKDVLDRIGNADLAEYITAYLGCSTNSEVLERDHAAYELLEARKIDMSRFPS